MFNIKNNTKKTLEQRIVKLEKEISLRCSYNKLIQLKNDLNLVIKSKYFKKNEKIKYEKLFEKVNKSIIYDRVINLFEKTGYFNNGIVLKDMNLKIGCDSKGIIYDISKGDYKIIDVDFDAIEDFVDDKKVKFNTYLKKIPSMLSKDSFKLEYMDCEKILCNIKYYYDDTKKIFYDKEKNNILISKNKNKLKTYGNIIYRIDENNKLIIYDNICAWNYENSQIYIRYVENEDSKLFIRNEDGFFEEIEQTKEYELYDHFINGFETYIKFELNNILNWSNIDVENKKLIETYVDNSINNIKHVNNETEFYEFVSKYKEYVYESLRPTLFGNYIFMCEE